MSEYGFTERIVKEKIDPGEGWELVPRDETRCKVDDEWRDAAGGWTRIREGNNAVGMPVKRVTECHPECLAIRRRKPLPSDYGKPHPHIACRCGMCGVTMMPPPPFAAEVAAELKRATEKYPTRTSQEKGFQLMMRHFIKLARSTSQFEARRRLVQIAAMCQRFAEDVLEGAKQ